MRLAARTTHKQRSRLTGSSLPSLATCVGFVCHQDRCLYDCRRSLNDRVHRAWEQTQTAKCRSCSQQRIVHGSGKLPCSECLMCEFRLAQGPRRNSSWLSGPVLPACSSRSGPTRARDPPCVVPTCRPGDEQAQQRRGTLAALLQSATATISNYCMCASDPSCAYQQSQSTCRDLEHHGGCASSSQVAARNSASLTCAQKQHISFSNPAPQTLNCETQTLNGSNSTV